MLDLQVVRVAAGEVPGDGLQLGDAALGEPPVPVEIERVDAERVDLERRVRPPVLGAVALQPVDRAGDLGLGVLHRDPAVAEARGAPEPGLGQAADVDRHRLRRAPATS